MRNKKKSVEFVMLSETYSADLRGRQSVRTTFKLTPRSIDALSLLAGQLGIKQKSIFDHLVDDTRALQALARDLENRAELGVSMRRDGPLTIMIRMTITAGGGRGKTILRENAFGVAKHQEDLSNVMKKLLEIKEAANA